MYILSSRVRSFSDSISTLEWVELMIVRVHIQFPYWCRIHVRDHIRVRNFSMIDLVSMPVRDLKGLRFGE